MAQVLNTDTSGLNRVVQDWRTYGRQRRIYIYMSTLIRGYSLWCLIYIPMQIKIYKFSCACNASNARGPRAHMPSLTRPFQYSVSLYCCVRTIFCFFVFPLVMCMPKPRLLLHFVLGMQWWGDGDA